MAGREQCDFQSPMCARRRMNILSGARTTLNAVCLASPEAAPLHRARQRPRRDRFQIPNAALNVVAIAAYDTTDSIADPCISAR